MKTIARIVDYPEESRAYYRWVRRCLDHLRAAPANRVRIHWSGPELDLASFRTEFAELLDKRINICGGVVVRAPREEEYELRRDARRLADHFHTPRTRHYGLETRLARRRFPEVDREMRAQRLDF